MLNGWLGGYCLAFLLCGMSTNLEILNAITNIQKATASKLQYEYQLCLANIELAKLAGVVFWWEKISTQPY